MNKVKISVASSLVILGLAVLFYGGYLSAFADEGYGWAVCIVGVFVMGAGFKTGGWMPD